MDGPCGVDITVRCKTQDGSESSDSFMLSDLRHMQLFSNAPAAAAQEGMALTSLPITVPVLRTLVELCKPQSIGHINSSTCNRLGCFMNGRGSLSLLQLLKCAAAVGLERCVCQRLDTLVASYLRDYNTGLVTVYGAEDGWARVNVTSSWRWSAPLRKDRWVVEASTDGRWPVWFNSKELLAHPVVWVVRAGCKALYLLLDELGMCESRAALAKIMLQQYGLLHLDANWLRELTALTGDQRLSQSGQVALMAAAMQACVKQWPRTIELPPLGVGVDWDAVLEAVTRTSTAAGVDLPGGAKVVLPSASSASFDWLPGITDVT